ncbi:MAG: fucose isomerase [Oscillospiraceae bacterium]|nr:fucose isomerase [Oscillospiraceae bacterium]
MNNIPVVKLGIVAVSRDCFPSKLSKRRREAVVAAYKNIYECPVIVENETDAMNALADLKQADVNALVLFLGNFGPEGPETLLLQKFLEDKTNTAMIVAAAEESGSDLIDGRGDAFCGMLNASYNIGLRKIKVYIPEYPVGNANEVAAMIKDFEKIAAVRIGISCLKIFSFGPRPHDFLTCNAPIAPLFDLGVEIQENSELDLYESFLKHDGDSRIESIAAEMAEELGKKGNTYPSLLTKLAQFEITLLDWAEKHLGASKFFTITLKCWPAFQTMFRFVPCYVNSRLASRGIPVACEVDIYGTLSEYILTVATGKPVTLLDINNTVPKDLYTEYYSGEFAPKYKNTDVFMGFHCGNTPLCNLKNASIQYQLIMKRNLEPDSEPDISRGNLDGQIKPSDVTIFRLQANSDSKLCAYIAQGEVLDMPTKTFGGTGVIAIPEMARFYRNVLIQKRFPHHSGIGFAHVGKILFDVLNLLGVDDVGYNRPAGNLYPSENPFA